MLLSYLSSTNLIKQIKYLKYTIILKIHSTNYKYKYNLSKSFIFYGINYLKQEFIYPKTFNDIKLYKYVFTSTHNLTKIKPKFFKYVEVLRQYITELYL